MVKKAFEVSERASRRRAGVSGAVGEVGSEGGWMGALVSWDRLVADVVRRVGSLAERVESSRMWVAAVSR